MTQVTPEMNTSTKSANYSWTESANYTVDHGNRTELCRNHEAWGTAIVLIESILIIVGNLFVLLIFKKYPSRRFKPLNYFIIQLAVADLFIGFIVLWIGWLSAKFYSYVTLQSGIIVYGILATATSTSTLSVLYIAIERYISVLMFQKFKKILTRAVVIVLIVISWLLPMAVFIIAPILGWSCVQNCDCSIYNLESNSTYCKGSSCSQMMTPFKKDTLLVGGLCLLLLLLASVVLYGIIFIRVHFERGNSDKPPCRKRSEFRMIKTMVIVLSGFLLTTGPLAILCIVSYFHNVRHMHFAMRILVVISNINSLMNPFFYFKRIPQMNANLKKLWGSFVDLMLMIFCCPPAADKRQRSRSSKIDGATSESSISAVSKSRRPKNRPAFNPKMRQNQNKGNDINYSRGSVGML